MGPWSLLKSMLLFGYAHQKILGGQVCRSLPPNIKLIQANTIPIAVIFCDSDPAKAGDFEWSGESMRSSLAQEIQETERNTLLQDPYLIVRMILRLASVRWQMVVRDQEAYTVPNLKSQYLGVIDERLLEKESFGEYLKQTFGMLQMNLRVFETLKSRGFGFAVNQLFETEELLADYQFLTEKVKAQIEHNSASIPVITAMIAVEESRKAMQQANDVK